MFLLEIELLISLKKRADPFRSVLIVRSCFLDVTTILPLLSLLFSVYQCYPAGAGFGCMIESVTIKWVTGSSKLKNKGETPARLGGLKLPLRRPSEIGHTARLSLKLERVN